LDLQYPTLLEEGAIVTDDLGFQVEAATVEEFLRLLEEREGRESAPAGHHGSPRGAVFVARMLDRRNSRFGYPSVTRHVVAAFAHGGDVVCLRRTTSHAVELPETAGMTEGRQRAVYDEIRAGIELGLEDIGLEVPVYEGSLRRSLDSRARK
jgi:hypothetical protein